MKTETFEPANDKLVKMYTCGPSTYQPSHIGNYRTFLFEDILQRYLEYSGYKVIRLLTLTNVEDKAIQEAEKERLTIEELTNKNETLFLNNLDKLKIKRPNFRVRASTIVDQAAALIKILLDKEVAYTYKYKGATNVYFDPLKFPGFGKLAHLDVEKWPKTKRRFHKDTYPGTQWNRGDFVLWHGCHPDDKVCWDTDIGVGRPAWNIQDAAMVTKHLGFSIDLAGGGVDNLVRHHDYTIAVAEAVSGKPFARFWVHGAHLLAEGKKMSKSIGNVYYPADLEAEGFDSQHIRFFLIYEHYRKKLNFTFQKLAATKQKLVSLKSLIQHLQTAQATKSDKKARTLADEIITGFEKHMDNDLDVKRAFDKVSRTVSQLYVLRQKNILSREDASAAVENLKKIDGVLQVIF